MMTTHDIMVRWSRRWGEKGARPAHSSSSLSGVCPSPPQRDRAEQTGAAGEKTRPLLLPHPPHCPASAHCGPASTAVHRMWSQLFPVEKRRYYD